MKTVARFQCDHCRKVSTSKAVIIKHERTCPSNEENRACKTCCYFCRGTVPACGIDMFDAPTKQNRFGLRIDCEGWLEIGGLDA